MRKLASAVRLQTLSEPVLVVGDTKLTPRSQTLTVRLPFAAFVFRRPVGIVVEQDGYARELAIVDVTRLVQLGLALLIAVLTIVTAAITRKERYQ